MHTNLTERSLNVGFEKIKSFLVFATYSWIFLGTVMLTSEIELR